MYPEILYVMAEDLLQACEAKDLRLALAESCTGGLIGGLITSVPGSSAVFDRGLVSYTNPSKGEMLGVPAYVFMEDGAVSEVCARAMAEGALDNSHANLSASVTGIAGPGGGSDDKPVGRIHIAVAREGFETLHEEHNFDGDRGRVRIQAVESVMRLLNQMAAK